MAGWLKDSNVIALFKECTGGGMACDAVKFADASLALISVFDLISGMGVASGDMKGNANTVKTLAQGKPGSTLQSLVDDECAGKSSGELKKIAGNGKMATCALLWLGRALNFILKMLDELMKEKTKKLSDCVLAGYEVSLRPHHGMMIRGTFSVAVKAAPYRADFIAKLGPDEETVFKELGDALPELTELLKKLQDMLVSKDASLFAP